jgi:hypothetical protein
MDAGDHNGVSASTAGDVNGDGLDYLIVGARNAGLTDKKEICKPYIIFGNSDETEWPLLSCTFLPLIAKPLVKIFTETVISCSVSLPATSVATMVTVSLSCADVCIVL